MHQVYPKVPRYCVELSRVMEISKKQWEPGSSPLDFAGWFAVSWQIQFSISSCCREAGMLYTEEVLGAYFNHSQPWYGYLKLTMCMPWQVLCTSFLSTNIYVFVSFMMPMGYFEIFFGGCYILLPYFSTSRWVDKDQ